MAVEIDFQIADRDRGRAVAVCAANDRIKVAKSSNLSNGLVK
jgi:hypothetical protein